MRVVLRENNDDSSYDVINKTNHYEQPDTTYLQPVDDAQHTSGNTDDAPTSPVYLQLIDDSLHSPDNPDSVETRL